MLAGKFRESDTCISPVPEYQGFVAECRVFDYPPHGDALEIILSIPFPGSKGLILSLYPLATGLAIHLGSLGAFLFPAALFFLVYFLITLHEEEKKVSNLKIGIPNMPPVPRWICSQAQVLNRAVSPLP